MKSLLQLAIALSLCLGFPSPEGHSTDQVSFEEKPVELGATKVFDDPLRMPGEKATTMTTISVQISLPSPVMKVSCGANGELWISSGGEPPKLVWPVDKHEEPGEPTTKGKLGEN